jgi:hypothetical protein
MNNNGLPLTFDSALGVAGNLNAMEHYFMTMAQERQEIARTGRTLEQWVEEIANYVGQLSYIDRCSNGQVNSLSDIVGTSGSTHPL